MFVKNIANVFRAHGFKIIAEDQHRFSVRMTNRQFDFTVKERRWDINVFLFSDSGYVCEKTFTERQVSDPMSSLTVYVDLVTFMLKYYDDLK